ncbi:MAG: CNNM domain-containing protein [Planctomycetota bacterium]|jgi:CBS domain containing-hemolysin-like protein
MNPRTEVLMIVAGALLAAFFSGAESGAYDLSRLRLRYRAREQGLAWAMRLERLLEDMPNFITAMLVWTNLALYMATWGCTSLFEKSQLDVNPTLAATLVAAPVLFIFAELVPKNLYRLRPERLMASSARALWLSVLVAGPIARVFSGMGGLLRRGLGLAEPRHWALMSRRTVRAHFAATAEGGGLSGPQRELVDNIILAGPGPALPAGTPVEHLPAFAEETTAAELLSRAGECPTPRVLVHRGAREEVVGVLRVLDAWGAPPDAKLSDLVREPVWLDGNVSIIQALVALRRAGETAGVISTSAAGDGPRRAESLVSEAALVKHLVGGDGSERDGVRNPSGRRRSSSGRARKG